MKNTKALDNKVSAVNQIGMKMKLSKGIIASPSVLKSQLEKDIAKIHSLVKELPLEEGEIRAKEEIKKTNVKHCQNLSCNELYSGEILTDRIPHNINKFPEAKKDCCDVPKLISYDRPKNWSREYSDALVTRIQAGNEAWKILEKAEIVSLPAENLIDLVNKVCDGKSASWTYVLTNLGLVISEAKKFAGKNDTVADFNLDLIHDSAITLFEAAQKYDGNKGCSLSTFGTMVIKRRISRYASKYMTLLHVSEDDLKRAISNYYEAKKENSENENKQTDKTEDDLKEKKGV